MFQFADCDPWRLPRFLRKAIWIGPWLGRNKGKLSYVGLAAILSSLSV